MEPSGERMYLVVPTNPEAPERRLRFLVDGTLVHDLVARVDTAHPTCEFTVDVTHLSGLAFDVTCDGEPIELERVHEKSRGYGGALRPLAHFTAREGWLNDPNGLTYVDGRYLMFFQHNPAGVEWGNMHWGSAESDDLVHWREGEILFFPDERGTAYSGCAFVDRANASGLGDGDTPPVLLFYTRAGNRSELSEGAGHTQNLAYSTDGGHSFTEYGANPLIDQMHEGNRDPKVIRADEIGCYLMVLYLGDRWFCILASKDLLHWRETHRWRMAYDAECPDLYPLPLDGDEGERKWVFSAASDCYLVGHLEGLRFIPETEERHLNYGNASYAAQSWSDLPDGRRLRTAFAQLQVPGERWACCMDLPQEMSLRTIDDEMRLCANPAPEVELLRERTRTFERLALPAAIPVASRAVDLRLAMPADESWSLSFRGFELRYDAAADVLSWEDAEAPVHGIDGIVEVRALIDTAYAEVFADGGSVFMGIVFDPDDADVPADEARSLRVEGPAEAWALEVSELKAFWE